MNHPSSERPDRDAKATGSDRGADREAYREAYRRKIDCSEPKSAGPREGLSAAPGRAPDRESWGRESCDRRD